MMITFIKGKLFDIGENSVTIECSGLGYEIIVPNTVNRILPRIGEEIFLYTYMQIREDGISLFGFADKDDLYIFKLLITVNGIGPKGAVGILSALSADDLRFAVLAEDAKTIERAPGIGRKTASKLILELKDKFSLEEAYEKKMTHNLNVPSISLSESSLIKDEAVQALVALGYSAADAVKAVKQVDIKDGMTSEDILKQSLKKI